MSIPFDNDIKSAEEYVVKEESRPKIIRGAQDIDHDFDQRQEEINDDQFFTAKSEPNLVSAEDEPDYKGTFCDKVICGLVRRCWS